MLLPHSFFQQAFIEHLLCANQCAGDDGNKPKFTERWALSSVTHLPKAGVSTKTQVCKCMSLLGLLQPSITY